MAWNRRSIVVQQTPPREETPKDRYLLILEAEPYSAHSAAVAYFLGKHEDKAQALLYAKRLAVDPEPALRFAGVTALVRLHCEGSRDAEQALWRLVEDPSSRVRAKMAEELKWDSLPETGRLKQALGRDGEDARTGLGPTRGRGGCDHHSRPKWRDLGRGGAPSRRTQEHSNHQWMEGILRPRLIWVHPHQGQPSQG